MKDLTIGKEGRLILNFATPMLLGNLFQQMYNIVDSIIVGNYLGKEALAAVGASFPILFSLISLIIGIASGGTIVISQFFGAKQYENVRKAIDTLYIFLFSMSIVVTILGICFSEDIFRLIQLPEDIIPEAKTYLNIYLGGLIVFFGFNGTSAVLRGLGDSKTPLYFLIIATLFNIGFDFLFIVALDFGIAGAAYATILSQAGAFITAIVYLNKTHEIIRFHFKGLLRFDKEIFKKSFRVGFPSGLQNTIMALGLSALWGIVNTFGTNVAAAYSAAIRVDSLAIMPAMNLSAALSTFVGQNIGAQKTERVQSGLQVTMIISFLITLVLSALIILFRENLMGLFTGEMAVIEVGKEYLLIVGASYMLLTFLLMISGVLRGAGDTLVPMFLTLLSLWVIRVPAAYLLSGEIGETGVWYASPISWFSGALLSYLYYRTGKWREKGVVNQKKEYPRK
jgi:putative MATE family efflux protein